jgi:hypothetical protein
MPMAIGPKPQAHRFSFFFLNVQQHDHKNHQTMIAPA